MSPSPKGILWLWFRAIDERSRTDRSEDRPSIQAITLVAHHRALYASPDGTNCYPTQRTLARLAVVEIPTVRRVDKWLQDQGLMELVRHQRAGQKEFRLVLPHDEDAAIAETVEGCPDNQLLRQQKGALASMSFADESRTSAEMDAGPPTTSLPPTKSSLQQPEEDHERIDQATQLVMIRNGVEARSLTADNPQRYLMSARRRIRDEVAAVAHRCPDWSTAQLVDEIAGTVTQPAPTPASVERETINHSGCDREGCDQHGNLYNDAEEWVARCPGPDERAEFDRKGEVRREVLAS